MPYGKKDLDRCEGKDSGCHEADTGDGCRELEGPGCKIWGKARTVGFMRLIQAMVVRSTHFEPHIHHERLVHQDGHLRRRQMNRYHTTDSHSNNGWRFHGIHVVEERHQVVGRCENDLRNGSMQLPLPPCGCQCSDPPTKLQSKRSMSR